SDLAGAAIGSALSLVLMSQLGPIRAFLFSALLTAVACLRVLGKTDASPGFLRRHRVRQYITLLLVGIGLVRPALFDPNTLRGLDKLLVRSEWTHLARTDAIAPSRYVIDGAAETSLDVAHLASFKQKNEHPLQFLCGGSQDIAVIGAGAGPD